MKRKLYTLILINTLICTACASNAGDTPANVTETQTLLQVNTETDILEPEPATEQQNTEENSDEPLQESLLPQQKRNEIEAFFNAGEYVYEPMLLEEVMLYLDEKGIRYESYYDSGDVRINMTLEDGTSLVFLETENIDGIYIGYALVMKGEYFNRPALEEHYLNCYDVIIDDYYYPSLSEQILTEEELYNLNLFDCMIARNELFAKHGRMFKDSFVSKIFELKSWYEPEYTAAEFDAMADELLTEIEKENLQILIEYEQSHKETGNAPNEVKKLVSGSWIDLDGDGTKEQITYHINYMDEDSYATNATLIIGNTQIDYDGYSTHENCYITSMDGIYNYIIIGEDGMSHDYKSAFYKYENGELNIVGEMYAQPHSLEVYADKIIAPEETQHFQCQPVKFRYELKNGSFEKQEDEYYDYRQNIVIANQDISLYGSKEDKIIDVIIFAGEEVQVMGGDMKNWVLLRKVATGEEGWMEVKDIETCILPDGSEFYSSQLFEGLYFYG